MQWSKSTYWRYEGATFDSEKEDIENPNYEILDYFRREFNLNSIDDLFTDEYKNYRDQYLEKRLQGLEELVQKALENLNISKGGNPCQD
ncbi:MAG: hypothetical protein NZ455_02515 [Bacteroidia bacterium]|nr:hypothetical protein [Bacteroidia bacterium]MDW8347004.1 hypothetical protein [Bacteroidia bacterium]